MHGPVVTCSGRRVFAFSHAARLAASADARFRGPCRERTGFVGSLITSLATGRASVVLANRQVPVEPANVRLIRLVS